MTESSDASHRLFTAHPRTFEANRYVYPVLSRRARGISVGVNLGRDKRCNFDCTYCQVDRSTLAPCEAIDLARLRAELEATLATIASGAIFEQERFRDTPEPLRRLNDIALSGDGEPTLCPDFAQVVAVCVDVLRRQTPAAPPPSHQSRNGGVRRCSERRRGPQSRKTRPDYQCNSPA